MSLEKFIILMLIVAFFGGLIGSLGFGLMFP